MPVAGPPVLLLRLQRKGVEHLQANVYEQTQSCPSHPFGTHSHVSA